MSRFMRSARRGLPELRQSSLVVFLGMMMTCGMPALEAAPGDAFAEVAQPVAATGEILPSPEVADLATARSFEESMSELAGLPGSESINEFRSALREKIGNERRDSIDPATTMAMQELVPMYKERWRLMKGMLLSPRHRFLVDAFELNCLLTGQFESGEIAEVFDRWQGDARGLLAVGCAEMALVSTSSRKAPESLLVELKSASETSTRLEVRNKAAEILRLLTEPPPKPAGKKRP